MTRPIVPLSQLRGGQRGTLTAVGGERSFRRRLMELGLTPGAEVRVLKVAPLGDPMELEVRGCRLSIRLAEARHLQVERLADAPLPSLRHLFSFSSPPAQEARDGVVP